MNKINFNPNNEFLSSEYKTKKSDNETDFKKLLEIEDYDSILKKTLSYLSDLEKESHLETLKLLEEEGYSKDELTKINLYLISKKENSFEELNLSDEDKQLLDIYNSIYEQIKNAIQNKREERLNLKPLQSEIFMSDTLLKTKDMIDGREVQEHSLNLEV